MVYPLQTGARFGAAVIIQGDLQPKEQHSLTDHLVKAMRNVVVAGVVHPVDNRTLDPQCDTGIHLKNAVKVALCHSRYTIALGLCELAVQLTEMPQRCGRMEKAVLGTLKRFLESDANTDVVLQFQDQCADDLCEGISHVLGLSNIPAKRIDVDNTCYLITTDGYMLMSAMDTVIESLKDGTAPQLMAELVRMRAGLLLRQGLHQDSYERRLGSDFSEN